MCPTLLEIYKLRHTLPLLSAYLLQINVTSLNWKKIPKRLICSNVYKFDRNKDDNLIIQIFYAKNKLFLKNNFNY